MCVFREREGECTERERERERERKREREGWKVCAEIGKEHVLK